MSRWPPTATTSRCRQRRRATPRLSERRRPLPRCAENKRAADCSAALAPTTPSGGSYFRLVIAVRSADSLAMPAAPHQLEPAPVGLIDVMLPVPLALKALVKALQLPLFRSVSE